MIRGNSFTRLAGCMRFAALACLLLVGRADAAETTAPNPLSPLNTSSPRATLQGFIDTVDGIYAGMTEVLEEYATSDRLYPTNEQRQKQLSALRRAQHALRALDLSGISPVLRDTVPAERFLQLKEVLDRIELPQLDEIPDRETMARLGARRWRLPGTEIDFVLQQDGPRAGEYLVSAETVNRLPEFYAKVAPLPYRPGAAKQLNEVFRRVSSGQVETIYEAFLGSPAGLVAVVPLRWILSLPGWAKLPIVGVAPWQWLGLSLGLIVCAGLLLGARRLARHTDDGGANEPGLSWRALPVPVVIISLAAFVVPLVCALLRIGGIIRVIIACAETTAFALSAAWLSIVVLIIVGDMIITSEHLRRRSLDSQLVRLSVRLIGFICGVAFLMWGADDLGFPAYSVLAGLGVGGLAVALAARDSIANLLGSLLIMVEKPFRIGHQIRISGTEGTVEDVGFRSTRIRTPDNSLISIPNNAVVNATVENLSLRTMRRQRFFVQVTYDTSREKLEALAEQIREVILDHPMTNKTNYQVRFNNFNESSLDILVMFYLEVADITLELQEREAILLRIMDRMSELGVEFAFPTRTLQIDAAPAAVAVPGHAST